MQLEDKVAVITGGSRGIGREIARTFAAEGASVALAARSEEALEETREVVEDQGGRSLVVPTDISDPEDVQVLASTTLDHFGRVDVLVNNSGIEGPTARLWEIEPDDWAQVVDVNLTGAYLCCRALLPPMIEREEGSLVFIGSVIGKRPQAGRSPYATTKLGLVGLVRTLAAELGPLGVRANLISPGMVAGERLERVLSTMAESRGVSVDEVRDELRASTPLEELVPAEDVARAAVFLASPASGSTTGEDLNVSAGMVMH